MMIASLLVGLVLAGATAPPRKLALLVGISKYERGRTQPPDWWNLSSHNDALAMKNVLVDKFGFLESDIAVVEDERATRDGIIGAFRSLIAKAQPGDSVAFHFSGHGQQVADDNGDEVDGLDESLVPFDYSTESAQDGAKTNLRDDALGALLDELAAKMKGPDGKLQGNITVFLDSCFSGTATRGVPDKGRMVARGRGWNEKLDGKKPIGHAAGDDGLVPAGQPNRAGYVLFTACRSDQTALQTTAEDNTELGALTYNLVKALNRATPRTTYREIMERLRVEVEEQDPQCEGPLDTLLFSGAALPAAPYSVASPGEPGLVRIPVGLLHGLTLGSRYAIYRAGSDVKDAANKLCEAEVTEVRQAGSTLRLSDSKLDPNLLRAARAVELSRSLGGQTLRVLASDERVRKALQGFDAVTFDGVTPSNYDVKVELKSGLWSFERKDGATSKPVEDGDYAIAAVRDTLLGAWRRGFVARMRNDDKDNLINVEARVVSAKPVPAGAERPVLQLGDRFRIQVRNLSPVAVYVAVLDLDAEGRIGPVYPESGNSPEAIPPDGAWHFLPVTCSATAPVGRDLLKVIATPEQIDLSPLFTDAARGGGDATGGMTGNKAVLGRLLQNAVQGKRGGPSEAPPPAYWATSDILLEVKGISK